MCAPYQDSRQGGKSVPTGDLSEKVSWDKKAVNRATMGAGCSVVQCVTTLYLMFDAPGDCSDDAGGREDLNWLLSQLKNRAHSGWER